MSHGAIRATIHDLGWLVSVLGGLALPVAAVGAGAAEWQAAAGLSVLAVAGLGGGLALTRVTPGEVDRIHAMRTTAIAWLLLGMMAAVPFAVWSWLDGGQQHGTGALTGWINPFFEGMSGITSTGLTVVLEPSQLPACLQLWRSALEWLGGVGIVVLALSFADVAHPPRALYVAEARSRRLGSSLRETTRRIWGLYLGLTAAAIGALWLSGESLWVALNHGLTSISTGGFTLHADSVASTGDASKLVAMVTMLIGATSFGLIRAVIRGRLSELWHSVQMRVFVPILAAAGVLAAVLGRGSAAPLDLVFQSTSAVATCGFSATTTDALGAPLQLVLIVAMLAGGMVGSTAGGIKAERLAVLCQGFAAWLRNGFAAPDRIRTDTGCIRQGEARDQLRSAARLTALLITSVTVGALALALLDGLQRPGLDYLFEATSAVGCVGLSIGLAGPELDTASKIVLTALMWIGRLEVVAIAVLLTTPISVGAHRVVGDARLKRMAGKQTDDLDAGDTSQGETGPTANSETDPEASPGHTPPD